VSRINGPVARRRSLPVAAARGTLIVPEGVLNETRRVLLASGGPDGPHEGLVFWAGWAMPGLTIIGVAIPPQLDHGWGHVRADETAVAAVIRSARQFGAGVLVQVHSHPGLDTRHSDGDDEMVLMPFDGMFSLVVGEYGAGSLRPDAGLGVHQFQDGRWVWIEPAVGALIILPLIAPP
jgi:proteasome lid subunit RPN8/RPN11